MLEVRAKKENFRKVLERAFEFLEEPSEDTHMVFLKADRHNGAYIEKCIVDLSYPLPLIKSSWETNVGISCHEEDRSHFIVRISAEDVKEILRVIEKADDTIRFLFSKYSASCYLLTRDDLMKLARVC